MKKLLLTILLCIGLTAQITMVAAATDVMEDEEAFSWYYTVNKDKETCKIYNYSGTLPEHVVVPEEIDGYKVTSISEDLLKEYGIKSIKLPSGIKEIDDEAFLDCSKLEAVYLSEGLLEIGNHAFENCRNLKSIILPNSTTKIGKEAFKNCTSLQNIQFGTGLTEIMEGAFSGCKKLESIELPEGLKSLSDEAFLGCVKIERINIPKALIILGERALDTGSNLKEITVSEGSKNYTSKEGVLFNKKVTQIIKYPTAKEGSYKIPNTVTKIGEYAFAESQITKVTIPNSVTFIDNYAFTECENLENVTIPSSVNILMCGVFEKSGLTKAVINANISYITEDTFRSCKSLRSVEFSKKITLVHKGAFAYCTALKDVYYGGSKGRRDTIKISSSNNPLKNATWHYAEDDKLKAPTVTIKTNAGNGKPNLTWKKIENAEKYEIYRATSKNGKYTRVYTTSKITYTNTGAKAGTKYYYKVKAISSETFIANSSYSTVKNITCALPRPVVKISLYKGDPKLIWDKIDGASKYEIYRATSKDGKYTKIYTTTVNTRYTNTSAKAGKTYYYKVKAISNKTANANSAYSLVKSIKAK